MLGIKLHALNNNGKAAKYLYLLARLHPRINVFTENMKILTKSTHLILFSVDVHIACCVYNDVGGTTGPTGRTVIDIKRIW